MHSSSVTNIMRTVLIGLTLSVATSCGAMSYFTETLSTEDRDKKAAVSRQEFDQTLQHLSLALSQQNYSIVSRDLDDLFQGEHRNTIFHWIRENMQSRMDHFCLFTYIRTKAMQVKAGFPIENLDEILCYIVADLILIASDITCCFTVGDDEKIFDTYTLFRDNYFHWYTQYFITDRIDFKDTLTAAMQWIDDRTKDQPSTEKVASNTKKFIITKEALDARYYYAWVRHIQGWSGDRLIGLFPVWKIGFGATPPQQLVGCINTKQVVSEWRQKSIIETFTYLHSSKVSNWLDFFKLTINDFNATTIEELRKKLPNRPTKTTPTKSAQMAVVTTETKDSAKTATTSGSASSIASSSFSASNSAPASVSPTVNEASGSASVGTASMMTSTPSQHKIGSTKTPKVPTLKGGLRTATPGSTNSSPRDEKKEAVRT